MPAAPESVPALSLRFFGHFEARLHGRLLTDLHMRVGARFLALLALRQGRPTPVTAVAKTLWPSTESLDSLRQTVAYVRRELGDQAYRLRSPKGALAFDTEGVDIDAFAFDAAINRATPGDWRAAIALYRGSFLQGWEERWIQKERDTRKERYLDALQHAAEFCRQRDDHAGAARYLRQYVNVNSASERTWCDLMAALVASGERVVAIDLYRRYREMLHEKYKIAPPPAMTELFRTVLAGEQPQPPAPESRPAPAGGALALDSTYYLERPIDRTFQKAMARRDSIVLVKGPRQTGKSSLLARGLHQARKSGAEVVHTDFQKLSGVHWESSETLYLALAQHIADSLELDVAVREVWDPLRGPNENFERYMRHEVLGRRSGHIVWGMDEVDRLFVFPYCTEVFALFRAWHNERSLCPDAPWGRLTLAIAYATEAHLFLSDLSQSPFNVGTRLGIGYFTFEQAAELNRRYNAPVNEAGMRRFYHLVGGIPYLVQRGLQEIEVGSLTLAAFESAAGHDTGCYGDHLRRMLFALMQDSELCEAVRGVLRGRHDLISESFYRLRSAGLIVGETPADSRIACVLYQCYLEAHLL